MLFLTVFLAANNSGGERDRRMVVESRETRERRKILPLSCCYVLSLAFLLAAYSSGSERDKRMVLCEMKEGCCIYIFIEGREFGSSDG